MKRVNFDPDADFVGNRPPRGSVVDGIPSGWLAKLTMRKFITEMADSLLALSESQ